MKRHDGRVLMFFLCSLGSVQFHPRDERSFDSSLIEQEIPAQKEHQTADSKNGQLLAFLRLFLLQQIDWRSLCVCVMHQALCAIQPYTGMFEQPCWHAWARVRSHPPNFRLAQFQLSNSATRSDIGEQIVGLNAHARTPIGTQHPPAWAQSTVQSKARMKKNTPSEGAEKCTAKNLDFHKFLSYARTIHFICLVLLWQILE